MNEEMWKSFFGKDYLQFSELILTPERTECEVNHIISGLNLPVGAQILDLGCGQGRISVPLSQRGYNMTGYDGAPAMVEEAKSRAKQASAHIRFVLGDMRELDYDTEFDAVINIGTAFGYVPDEADDAQILRRVASALKPRGLFLQDMENREFKLSQPLGKVTYSMNGNKVCSDKSFNLMTGRWMETISWVEGSELKQAVLNLRLYTLTELCKMLQLNGFEIVGVYGSLDFSEFKLDSTRLIILSQKMEWGHNFGKK